MVNKIKIFEEKASELDWSLEVQGSTVEFNKHSPAGEDFYIILPNVEDFAEIPYKLRYWLDCYDAEAHAISNYGATGAPCLKSLLEDAEQMQQDILELQLALEEI